MTGSIPQYISFNLICVCFFAGLAQGQPGQMGGPSIGWIHDTGSRSVRPILGVPGAAYLGAPIIEDVSFAAISPSGNLALARKGAQIFLLKEGGAAISTPLADGYLTAATVAVWAADSSAVILYEAETRRVQVIRNFSVGPDIDSPFALPVSGLLTALAVSSGGAPIAAGMEREDGGGLYIISQGAAQRIDGVGKPVSTVFNRDGSRLIAADAALRRIVEYETKLFLPVAGTPGDMIDATALAISVDSQEVYAVSAASKTLSVFDRTSWQRTAEIQLEFTPQGLTVLGEKNVLGLAAGRRSGDPVWIFSSRPPAVYFVPGGMLDPLLVGESQ